MEPSADEFRRVMGHFATGVTVVTTFDGDLPKGVTVNALSSVSLEPPLVLVALDRTRRIVPALRAAGRFAVSILSEEQQALSECFAGAAVVPDREAFCGAAWHPGTTGLPLIDGAVATLECTTSDVVTAGDHDLFIGRVVSLAGEEHHAMPLLYYRRRYVRFETARASGPRDSRER
jgi:flavin reductase (DIM6/NTAB) family NADH-FMN oxidoreductase RutF